MGRTFWIATSLAALGAALAAPAANAQPAYVAAAHVTHVIVAPHAPVRTWVPGHWEHRRHGNVWVEGHWALVHPRAAAPQAQWQGGRDQDRDGVPNRYDRDIDGDGVPNWRDRAPRRAGWR